MESLHYLLMKAHTRMHRRIRAQAAELGLTSGQPKILEFLREHQGCTQKEIGRGCVLDKSSVTGLLRRMEEAELVRREVCPQDRRAARIYLTDRGMELAQWVQGIFDQVDALGWGDIPQEEREQCMATLRKVIRNFENREESE